MWATHYLLLGFFGGSDTPTQPTEQSSGGAWAQRQRITRSLLAQRKAQEQQQREAERLAQEQASALAAEQAVQALERFQEDAAASHVNVPAQLDVQRIAADAIQAARGVRPADAVAGRQVLADAQALAVARTTENSRRAQLLLAVLEAWR